MYPAGDHPFAEVIRVATCAPAATDSELDTLGKEALEVQARFIVSLLAQPRVLAGILPVIIAALPSPEVTFTLDPARLRVEPITRHTPMSKFGALIGAILGLAAGLIAMHYIGTGVFYVFTDKDTQLALSSGADLLPYQLFALLCTTGIGWALGQILSPDPTTAIQVWYDTPEGDSVQLPHATMPVINRQEA